MDDLEQRGPAMESCDSASALGLSAEQRGDIDNAMKDGVAVVSYDCKQLTLLKDCRLEGEYGFMGHPPQLTRTPGSQGVGRFELTMVSVGEVRTNWQRVLRPELRGRCDGATHVIRGASVGAFELKTETGSRSTMAAEGDVAACATANPNTRRSNGACHAALQFFLLPIEG